MCVILPPPLCPPPPILQGANLAEQIRRTSSRDPRKVSSDGVGESALEGRRGITIRLLAGSETGATSTGCSGCPPRETQRQQQ